MNIDEIIKQKETEIIVANARIAELEAEAASREQSNIEEHNEVHYWRDRAKKAELDLSVLQAHDKEAMELLDWSFAILQLLCGGTDTAHLRRYEALKAQSNAQEDTKDEQGGSAPNNL